MTVAIHIICGYEILFTQELLHTMAISIQSTLKQISGQIICCRWPALDAKIKDPPAGGMLRNQRH